MLIFLYNLKSAGTYEICIDFTHNMHLSYVRPLCTSERNSKYRIKNTSKTFI